MSKHTLPSESWTERKHPYLLRHFPHQTSYSPETLFSTLLLPMLSFPFVLIVSDIDAVPLIRKLMHPNLRAGYYQTG